MSDAYGDPIPPGHGEPANVGAIVERHPLAGKRIRLVRVGGWDEDAAPVGAVGIVTSAYDNSTAKLGSWTEIHVRWDPPNEDKTSILLTPEDEYELVDDDG